jgi:hypothetical protein
MDPKVDLTNGTITHSLARASATTSTSGLRSTSLVPSPFVQWTESHVSILHVACGELSSPLGGPGQGTSDQAINNIWIICTGLLDHTWKIPLLHQDCR